MAKVVRNDINILERIKQNEGLRLKPYRCTAGKLTIGYGRNIEDNGITEAEASFLLENDIKNSEAECCRAFSWFQKLDDIRRGVIIELCFNMGLKRLRGFKKMLAACECGNYDNAAAEMLNSLWARQVGKRAKTLADLMKGKSNA